jgi:hypothetical protein
MAITIPVDYSQCQTEKPNGNSFMTLGGRPGLVRCTNKPTVVAVENKPGADGCIGSMSLCDSCKDVLIKQLGPDFASFRAIEDNQNVQG